MCESAPQAVSNSCNTSFLTFDAISEEDLKKIILASNITTCPLDPIPSNLLIQSLDVLLPTLTDIVNDSLRTGHFPKVYKTASVKPLLKNTSLDTNNLKNYRPVSNLSFMSKIVEKVVQQQLFAYLSSNRLLPDSQSAYRPFHSTETALIKVVNDLLIAMDQGNVSILTLLDLSSAFDTIDHDILLERLSSLYGISGVVLSWFQSYLSDRTQFVTIDDNRSNTVNLEFGVPQAGLCPWANPIYSIHQAVSYFDRI